MTQPAVTASAVHGIADALDAQAQDLERLAADLRARARELRETKPARADARRLLRVRDLAELLQIDPRTVRRWRSEGRLPEPIAVAGVLRWDRCVVDAWLAARVASSNHASLPRQRAG